ncbi:MAG: hypothetical protein IID55_04790 [Proteobacteria bacterium]|nr:hypothetical protein [Pseudomonadota bacterium]
MTFFQDPGLDQLYGVVVALTAEVSVLADRLDTMERLLDANGSVSRADIEAYRADETVEGERTERRDGYIGRVFQAISEEAQALRAEG